MEFNQKYYNYSMKNIPIPSKKLYRTTLIENVDLLIKQIRSKAHLFESSGKGQSNPLHYVLPTTDSYFEIMQLIQSKFDIPNCLLNVTL